MMTGMFQCTDIVFLGRFILGTRVLENSYGDTSLRDVPSPHLNFYPLFYTVRPKLVQVLRVCAYAAGCQGKRQPSGGFSNQLSQPSQSVFTRSMCAESGWARENVNFGLVFSTQNFVEYSWRLRNQFSSETKRRKFKSKSALIILCLFPVSPS